MFVSSNVPIPTTLTDDSILMPMMEGSAQLTSITASTSKPELPRPTPTPTMLSNDLPSGDGSGDIMVRLPLPTNTAPDIIIRLRLMFSVELNDEERMQVEQNLSSIVQDILQLTIPPVVTQEPDNIIFSVLIVTSSSMDTSVASGNISAINTTLTGELAHRLTLAVRQTIYKF